MSTVEALLARFRYRPDEESGGLAELPTSSVEPDRPAGAEELQLLTFGLGGGEYAVSLGTVTGSSVRARSPRFQARPPLLGVLNLRGPSPRCTTRRCGWGWWLGAAARGSGLRAAAASGAHPGGAHRARSGGALGGPGAACSGSGRGARASAGRADRWVVGILQTAEGTCTVVDPEWLLR
jgi:hypothetical protein